MDELIHLHPNKIDRDLNLFLILIPIIFFVMITTFILLKSNKSVEVATTYQTPSVLGQETVQK